MRPDTWVPTCTVTVAESVPVAVTLATTSPRATLTVTNWGTSALPRPFHHTPNPTVPASSTPPTAMTFGQAAIEYRSLSLCQHPTGAEEKARALQDPPPPALSHA